ncbi:RE1-silencing transcription factor-like isoform X2 [Sitophilus oryzae]|uniref:RE1-silencing transcription factor-like isoform X2 n=1 Tax=Sitophilus oryzae TaxID=7048 RepID=A0A6J2YQM1_SITOR|nr:RE1-silencing transcription factor-like isoform X2 [Sitophilus oryzae]
MDNIDEVDLKPMNESQKKVYRCSICSYQTRHMTHLRRHEEVHVAPEERQWFACAHCERKYMTKRNLIDHLKDNHTDSRLKEVQKKVHTCSTCSYQTQYMSKLSRHEKVHLAPEERQMFTCAHCNNKYRTKHGLQRHLKHDHVGSREKESNESQEKVYRCTSCNHQTRHMASLRQHKKIHLAPEKQQMLVCAQCDEEFMSNRILQNHIKRDHIDSRNADCISPNDEVVLDSLKIEIDDYTPHLDDFKNAECLSITNKVKSEDFFKIEPDDVEPVLNKNMHGDFTTTENLSVTEKIYITLEDYIKMEADDDDEDTRF